MFQAKFPGIVLTLTEMTSSAQIAAIADHQMDLGVVRKPSGRLLAAVRLTRISTDPAVIALPKSSPLARKTQIQISELKGVPLVCLSRAGGAGLHEFVTGACWAAGFAPHIVQEVVHVSTMIALVSAGFGAAIIPAPLQRMQLDRVVYRPLLGKGTLTDLFVAHHSKSKNRWVSEFKQMLMAQAGADT